MKNAAMKAGDALTERGTRREAAALVISELLSGWFEDGNGDAAVFSDCLAVPAMARRTQTGYALDDFVRGAAGYDGPCFAVSGAGADTLERGLFDVGVSIAFLTDGQPLAAVVYDPVHVELFHAVSGLGAYLNGKSIKPSKTRSLAGALVSLDHAILRSGDKRALLDEAGQIRVAPVAALELCYAACGRVDAALRRSAAFFDYAAGLLVATEAGAAVSDGRGGPVDLRGEYGQRRDLAVLAPGLKHAFI
jgi:hypothetical protein